MKTMIVMTMIMTTMMTLKPKHPRGRDQRKGALAQAITQTPNPRPQAKTPPLRCRRSRKGVLAQAKPQTLNPKVLKPKHPRGRDRRMGALAQAITQTPNPRP